jgi:predicted nucleic acid-binding protein
MAVAAAASTAGRSNPVVFLDTSVLLAGLIDFGPQSAPAQQIMLAVADRSLSAVTAWHCCLEVYSVATRLPPEYRVAPPDAARLLQDEVLARLGVHELPPGARAAFLAALVQDQIAGGRIYDAHIADVARAAGAAVIVTDNRRHFLAALRHAIRVETPGEFLAARRKRPPSP